MTSTLWIFLVAVILLVPIVAAGQNSGARNATSTTMLRQVAFRCHLGADQAECADVYDLLRGSAAMPTVERTYDQKQIDNACNAIREAFAQRGISVNVETRLTQIRDTRYAKLEFLVRNK